MNGSEILKWAQLFLLIMIIAALLLQSTDGKIIHRLAKGLKIDVTKKSKFWIFFLLLTTPVLSIAILVGSVEFLIYRDSVLGKFLARPSMYCIERIP